MMALVRSVILAATEAGSILPSLPMSASTGVAPVCRITLTVAQNVRGVVITSSPGPIPSATNAKCSPAVQELTPKARGAATYSANSFSNCDVRGPVVSQPERRVRTTSSISSFPILGR